MCLPYSPQSQWIQPSTSSRIYWKRITPSRKGLLWKLVTLSSYWSFVSSTHTFLSKISSINRLRVLPWIPQLAPLWPTSTWSTWNKSSKYCPNPLGSGTGMWMTPLSSTRRSTNKASFNT